MIRRLFIVLIVFVASTPALAKPGDGEADLQTLLTKSTDKSPDIQETPNSLRSLDQNVTIDPIRYCADVMEMMVCESFLFKGADG